jgi:hypothetical protein
VHLFEGRCKRGTNAFPVLFYVTSQVGMCASRPVTYSIQTYHSFIRYDIYSLFLKKNRSSSVLNCRHMHFRHIPQGNVLICFCGFCSAFDHLPWHINISHIIRHYYYVLILLVRIVIFNKSLKPILLNFYSLPVTWWATSLTFWHRNLAFKF